MVKSVAGRQREGAAQSPGRRLPAARSAAAEAEPRDCEIRPWAELTAGALLAEMRASEGGDDQMRINALCPTPGVAV